MTLRDGLQEVHGQVAAEIALLVPQLDDAIDELARALAADGGQDGPPAVDAMTDHGVRFLGLVRPMVAGIGERLGADLPTHVEIAPDRATAWAERIRTFLDGVLEYGDGYVDGGGVALALLTECHGAWTDRDAIRRVLAERFAFLHYRVEAAAVQWAQEVARELDPAQPTPRPAQSRAPRETAPSAPVREARPEPSEPAPPIPMEPEDELSAGLPPEPPPEKLAPLPKPRRELLADAPTMGFPHPALDRDGPLPMGRNPDAPEERQARLDELMAFAAELKVRVKKVPDLPSSKWLDKMEAKLTEIAIQRGVGVPAGFGAPTAELDTGRLPESGLSDQERRDRIDAMLAKAEKAGLKLGRVPKDPSDAWLYATEENLEQMLEARRAEKKAERERIQKERKARIERLKVDAEALGVDLGPFPAFPTDDWLARAEIRIAQVMLTREAAAQELAESDSELLDAEEGEPEDDEPEPEPEREPIAVILYEEGTVQEEAWIMKEDRLTIGRARGSHVQILHDAGISRTHCAVVKSADGAFALEDLGSTKGTLVNGIRVSGQTRLLPGAIIQVGDTELVFRVR